ncbi:MAG: 23S rRNA (pseudouridine(1915)-N(3))-methyltransferase RlmH [Desulfobacca sp.]|uniref:23S rRNA (pseudouridine(1915)-N(3))-methyltransferase RlmH n=1 Tax=Desulfobacca sp. TaxID=2067990 RepID=UPI004049FC1D
MGGLPLVLLMVGKTRSAFVQAGLAYYAKRLQPYHPLELVTVREEKPGAGLTPEQIKDREGARILARLPKAGRIIALEATGQEFTSPGLAEWLAYLAEAASSPLIFVIGGHLGLAATVRQAAHYHLSLSRLTFTHEMSRLILVEQLYRAATIRAGHPYHL